MAPVAAVLLPLVGADSIDEWLARATKLPAALAAVVVLVFVGAGIVTLLRTLLSWKPSIVVRRLKDDAVDAKVGGAVGSLIEERLLQLAGSASEARGTTYDLDLISTDIELFAEQEDLADAVGGIGELPQMGYLMALLNWVDRIAFKRRFAVSGELLPEGKEGHGIAIALYKRNGVTARGTLWETSSKDWLPEAPGGDDPPDPPPAPLEIPRPRLPLAFRRRSNAATPAEPEPSAPGSAPFYRLAGGAASWVQYELARELNKGVDVLTASGESFALASSGLQLQRNGDPVAAADRYARALGRDDENVIALANAAILARDVQLHDLTLQMLGHARLVLEQRHAGGPSKGFKAHLDDPIWYRIVYAQGAGALSAMSTTATSPDRDREARLILEALAIPALPRNADPAQVQAAAAQLQTLLQTTSTVLAGAGCRWPRRRAGRVRRLFRWLRHLRNRSPARRHSLADFLGRTIEPAVVVALLSLYHEKGRSFELPNRPRATPDRNAISDRVEQPDSTTPGGAWTLARQHEASWELGWELDWLIDYAAELTAGLRPDGQDEPPLGLRLAAWLGVTRYRQPQRPTYRVEYNLACLLARLGRHEDALRSLRTAFENVPVAGRRRRLAQWAWEDPGLADLRDNPEFARIVGRPTDELLTPPAPVPNGA